MSQDFLMFGINFIKLNESHLEMIRNWRNSEDVRVFMIHQKIISKEDQIKWFSQLDKRKNYYYVAYKNNIPFGLYNLKDVDFHRGVAEPGVFVGNKDFWGNGLAMRGSIAMGVLAFEVLNLEELKIQVLESNSKVLSYNLRMGYSIVDKNESGVLTLLLKRYNFFNNRTTSKLLQFLRAEN
jgi:UDP-4-amino-4,6-dideoxy-N-acetyl-beta-L-altrosamine N-acetyltransferase